MIALLNFRFDSLTEGEDFPAGTEETIVIEVVEAKLN